MLVLLPSHFVKFLYFDLPKIFFSTLQDPLRIYIMAVFCSTKINFRKIFFTFMRGLKMLVIHVALVGEVQNSLIVNYNNNEFIKMFCWLAFLQKVSLETVKEHSRLIFSNFYSFVYQKKKKQHNLHSICYFIAHYIK